MPSKPPNPTSHKQPAHSDAGHRHEALHGTTNELTKEDGHGARPYLKFWITMALSLAVMYAAMFTMIDGWGDFRHNLDMLYMTTTMWAPMGIVMLLAMRDMYVNRKINVALLVLLSVLTVASFGATRTQMLIRDGQFIDSMIPHHSGAILMCREAALTDPELTELCGEIIEAQRDEIERMERIADRLDR